MDLSEFIKSNDILSDLNDESINFVASSAQLIEYAPMETILKIGEINRYLWIVYDGEVEVSLPETDGGMRAVASLDRGQVFGEMSIMTGEPAIAKITAQTLCKLVRIPRDTLSQILLRNPQILTKLTRIITMRLLQNERDEQLRERQRIANKENEDPYDLNFSSVLESMNILVINCGSSSVKYSLFTTSGSHPLMEGLIEKIGSGRTTFV